MLKGLGVYCSNIQIVLRVGQSVYPSGEMNITSAIHSFIFMYFEVSVSRFSHF